MFVKNGKIYVYEQAEELKSTYNVSDCDSEIILGKKNLPQEKGVGNHEEMRPDSESKSNQIK